MLLAVLFLSLAWVSGLGSRLGLEVASGHTATNTPDLFRTPKLTVAGPGQYWGGGPPGKSFGCCRLILFDKLFSIAIDLGHWCSAIMLPTRDRSGVRISHAPLLCTPRSTA